METRQGKSNRNYRYHQAVTPTRALNPGEFQTSCVSCVRTSRIPLSQNGTFPGVERFFDCDWDFRHHDPHIPDGEVQALAAMLWGSCRGHPTSRGGAVRQLLQLHGELPFSGCCSSWRAGPLGTIAAKA